MKADRTFDAATLRELVRYEDGRLYWRDPGPRQVVGPLGSPAGHGGRLQMPILGSAHYVHRLVWLYHHGDWPADQIDHINGDKLDNRIENLRESDNRANAQNVLRKTGGVSLDKRSGRWRARIMANGRNISLGYYNSEAEARAEYLRAKLHYHEPFRTGVAAA